MVMRLNLIEASSFDGLRFGTSSEETFDFQTVCDVNPIRCLNLDVLY